MDFFKDGAHFPSGNPEGTQGKIDELLEEKEGRNLPILEDSSAVVRDGSEKELENSPVVGSFADFADVSARALDVR